jgi:hypothetical protein
MAGRVLSAPDCYSVLTISPVSGSRNNGDAKRIAHSIQERAHENL